MGWIQNQVSRNSSMPGNIIKPREMHTDLPRLLAFTFDLSHRMSYYRRYSMYRTGEEMLPVFLHHWVHRSQLLMVGFWHLPYSRT